MRRSLAQFWYAEYVSQPTPHLQVSLPRRRAITAGLLLGMSLGALEATVVSTAMPTVIATLGGLAHYSWVFSAYLLTSTASVPIWGRLSDLYGRRRMYLLGVAVFLVGSVMSGAATSMFTLIAARAIQGLGAGAIIPMSMTIVGELYTLAERARTQALFSGVWGVASIAGPLVGGYITDALSWRWVFYLNVPFGFCCMAVIALAYPAARLTRQVQVDWLGAALLFSGISTLLIAIGGDAGSSLLWLAATVVLLGGFVVAQRRAAEPILPLSLVRLPVISRTIVVVFLVGIAMFGAIAFIPLFVQSVQGGTATQAGQVLTPLFLGWVVMSIVGARITVRIGYRVSAIGGSILMTAGFLGLSLLDSHSPRMTLLVSCTILGAGMGTQMLSLLLAVQHARRSLAARARHVAQPVLTQHRRSTRCVRDGRDPRARPHRTRTARWRRKCAGVRRHRAVRTDARSVRCRAASRVHRGRRRLRRWSPGDDVSAACELLARRARSCRRADARSGDDESPARRRADRDKRIELHQLPTSNSQLPTSKLRWNKDNLARRA